MQKLLIKLAQPFVDLDFISPSEANIAIKHIFDLPFVASMKMQKNLEEIKIVKSEVVPNLTTHLKNIDELRNCLLTVDGADLLIENWINHLLSFFMPSNEMINKWTPTTKYARLYLLSQYAYYIKTDQNNKNLIFHTHNPKYGEFTISINLAKPEKTQTQIIAEKNAPKSSADEPQCGICIENLNFHGTATKPSRENLRVIYETLDAQKWFFQYSPYAYLGGHFVLNNIEHTPMVIDEHSIARLFKFIDKHPEFMLGSNADLPIVGGSLLGHNHFQGATDRLPITKAKRFIAVQYDKCLIELLYWPLNTIRISSSDKTSAVTLINKLIHFWRAYQTTGLTNNQNNTVTLITEKVNHQFVCYVILRNNSVSEKYPFGNYHVHPEKFHIKQENIGLMEAAGLAILPGRLINEFNQIIALLNNTPESGLTAIENDPKLNKHAPWLKTLMTAYPKLTYEILVDETAKVFIRGLEDCTILNKNQFTYFIKQFLVAHPLVIRNERGLEIKVLNIGNIIQQINFHDKPLLLEYANPDNYLNNVMLLNAFVGPACGRIEKGQIRIDEKLIQLQTDDKQNYIHGMSHKWSDLLYDITIENQTDKILIHFKGIQDNPELKCHYIIYNALALSKTDNAISMEYEVTSDQKTLCNPSHHFYWTLDTPRVLGNNLHIEPQGIWRLNPHKNPVKLVKTTPQTEMPLQAWMQYFDSLTSQNSEIIDHPLVLTDSHLTYSSQNIVMHVQSSIAELVIYTYLNRDLKLFRPGQQQGVCFEYQFIPTSLANQNFANITTNHYQNWTKYYFQWKKI